MMPITHTPSAILHTQNDPADFRIYSITGVNSSSLRGDFSKPAQDTFRSLNVRPENLILVETGSSVLQEGLFLAVALPQQDISAMVTRGHKQRILDSYSPHTHTFAKNLPSLIQADKSDFLIPEKPAFHPFAAYEESYASESTAVESDYRSALSHFSDISAGNSEKAMSDHGNVSDPGPVAREEDFDMSDDDYIQRQLLDDDQNRWLNNEIPNEDGEFHSITVAGSF